MKNVHLNFRIIQVILILFVSSHALAQEWESLRSYQRETGNSILTEGSWLKKDRIHQTEIWNLANRYNLISEYGEKKYKTISQKRDFYLWFDKEIKNQGHEINWAGIASIAAGQLSYLDKGFIRVFIIRNNELVEFSHEGSEKVFAFAFPKFKKIYFSKNEIKGKDAELWDQKYGMDEQCKILEPLYNNLSDKALNKLEKMAKGKGVFIFGVPKELRFVGKIDDCQLRVEHGKKKLLPYYIATQ